jgi:hypothetical protein
MVLKSIVGSASLATLLFSTVILSGPVGTGKASIGPFGQLVRDAKANIRSTSSSVPVEKRDRIAFLDEGDEVDEDDERYENDGSSTAMRFLSSKTSSMISKSLPLTMNL